MSNKISAVIDKLKDKLEDYMYLTGIHPPKGARHFSCPNKAGHVNGDANPSASLFKGNDGKMKWNCFSCHSGSDIFAMAHYIDNLPLDGPEFITVTVKTLCEKLGMEFDLEKDLSEEEKERLDCFKANKLIADYLATHQIETYLISRDIDEHIAKKLSIGSIDNDALSKLIKEAKIPKEILTKVSIYNQVIPGSYTGNLSRAMFNNNRLIFTIHDKDGNPIGFTARDMTWTKESKSPKYINSANNPVFRKSEVLYLIDKARKKINESGMVYIVEGPTDAVRLYANGVSNVVGQLGTAFTELHLDMLKNIGATHIIFALDGDKAGHDSMISNIEDIMQMDKEIKLSVKILPDHEDPDSLIRKSGIAAFIDLPTYEFPEYVGMLMLAKMGKPQEELINEYIKWLLTNVPKPISRSRYIERLAKMTNVDIKLLNDQMNYYIKIGEVEAKGTMEKIFYKLSRDWKESSPDSKLGLLDSARKEMGILLWKANSDIIGSNRTDLTDMEERLINKESEALVTGYARFDHNITIPKSDSRILFGAYPNIGKSNFTRNLAYNIIIHNPDVSVLYCSLDDPKIKTIPAFIGMMKNHPINNIRYPKSLPPGERKNTEMLLRSGFRELHELIGSKRLIIKDQVDIPTVDALESHIIAYVDELKELGNKLVVFVDSLHSFMDLKGNQDIRGSVIQAISEMKRLSNTYHPTIIMNGELNKEGRYTGKRPTLANLSETGRIEYLVDVGGIIHSDMFYKKSDTERKWRKKDVDIDLPILEIHIEKNKEAYYKGDIWFYLDPICGTMRELTVEDERDIRSKEEEKHKK